MKKRYKVASLFTGCGGMDLGFVGGFEFLGRKYKKNPFEIVFSNDNDKDAVATYSFNKKLFSHSEIVYDDVQNVDENSVGDFDVLTAGFPCQPFSTAGDRKGVHDERGTLFEEVFRFVRSHKPKIVIMENVRGILSSKMPNGVPVANEIVSRISKVKGNDGKIIKYNVMPPYLVNASDFGVPQNRHRVFIVAVREDLKYTPYKFDLHKFKVQVEESDLLVRNIVKGVKGLPNQNDVWHFSPQAQEMVKYIKRSWKDIPYDKLPERFRKIRDDMKKYRAPNFYRRFGLDEINGTITASSQPENCGILHPLEDRRYSVREIARIQSFPDNFIFENTRLQDKYKVIGNAVPPVLAHAIAGFCAWVLSSAEV